VKKALAVKKERQLGTARVPSVKKAEAVKKLRQLEQLKILK
jgi:hypothetical protein